MSWWQFRYIFDKTVKNALRYSIHEALRRQARSAGGATADGVADDAIATFERKMDKHAPGDHAHVQRIAELKAEVDRLNREMIDLAGKLQILEGR